MIPKIIHFCWMSDDAFPEKIQNCINSWKRNLPEYEIIQWSYRNFPKGQSKWVDQAFEAKKYAFCADYIRCYSVYNYGGIYLDSDVEVIKKFDDLLNRAYFIGQEASEAGIEAAVIGAAKGNPILKAMLDYYAEREFVKQDGTFDTTPMPILLRRVIDSEFPETEIFPVDYFSPKDFMKGDIHTTSNTYSIHHFAGTWMTADDTWRPEKTTFKKGIHRAIKKLLPINRKMNLLSNTDIDKRLASIAMLKTVLPLQDVIITEKDMNILSRYLRDNVNLTPQFVKRSQAQNKATGYYPILTFVEVPEIEIHYPTYYSNKVVEALWKRYLIERNENTTVILRNQQGEKIGRIAIIKAIISIMMTVKRDFVEIYV